MPKRNGLASEYEAAPLVRLACDDIAIENLITDITSQIPYKALIDGAPYVNILLGYLIDDPSLGPRIAIGSAGVLAQAPYQRVNRAAGFTVIRVRKVLPRESSTSTTLIDGNRVFLLNTDVDVEYNCSLIIEAPSLNWV